MASYHHGFSQSTDMSMSSRTDMVAAKVLSEISSKRDKFSRSTKFNHMVAEGWTNQYVDPRKAAKSYRPRAGTMSPGLLRARAPYRIRNVATGLLLGAFAVGIYSYSIHAVKQEEFDDIDDEARTLRNRTPSKISQEDEKRAMEAATSSVVSNVKGK